MADYVTIDDYFDGDGWNSPCQSTADGWTDDVWAAAQNFLKRAGLRMTSSSEWAYGIQCNGIHVETNGDTEDWEPVEVSDDDCDSGDELDLYYVYERHYARLKAIWEWIDKKNDHLKEAPIVGFWEYARHGDRNLVRKVSKATDDYEKAIEVMCDELARTIKNMLESAHEAAESDEQAFEWVWRNYGVPIRRDDVDRLLGSRGIELSDDEYDEMVDLIGRYMEATKSSDVNDREVITAARLVAA